MKSSSNDFRPLINTIANFIVYLFGLCGFVIIAYLFDKAGLSEYKVSLLVISIVTIIIILCNYQLRILNPHESMLSRDNLATPIVFILLILVAHVIFIALALLVGDLIAMTLDYSPHLIDIKTLFSNFWNFLSINKTNGYLVDLSHSIWIVGVMSVFILFLSKYLKDSAPWFKIFISYTYLFLAILLMVICLLAYYCTFDFWIFICVFLALTCLVVLYDISKKKKLNSILLGVILIIGCLLVIYSFLQIQSYWNSNKLDILLFWLSLFVLTLSISLISAALLMMILLFGRDNSDKTNRLNKILTGFYEFINNIVIPIVVIALSISLGSILLTFAKDVAELKSIHVNLFYLSLTIVAAMVFSPFVFYAFIQIPFYLYSFLRDRLEMEIHTRNKRDIINIHFHLLNSEYVPDSYLSSLIPSDIPFTFSKRILRLPLLTDFVEKFLLFFPMENEKLTGEWIKLIARKMKPDSFTNRLDKPESEWSVIEVYLDEMEKAGEFKMAVPLLMDLNDHSYNSNPDVHYTIQIDEISEIAKRYPFKIMPFVMFDPRRSNALELVIDALENKGFLGVKLYPSMGYDLDFSSKMNDSSTNEALAKIYEYCAEHRIPITIHSSKGGNIAETISARKDISDGYSNPDKWNDIFKYNEKNQIEINSRKYPEVDLKNLIINLAHFGGDLHENNQIGTRAKIIEDLMMKSEYNVYTDIACNLLSLNKNNEKTYFINLENALKNSENSKKIMFGTDWMMTRRTYREKDFADKYIEFFYNFMLYDIDSILKYEELINNLQKRDKDYEKRIYSNLDKQCKKIIDDFISDQKVSEPNKRTLIKGFNKILNKAEFYSPKEFTNLILSVESENIRNKGLKKLGKKEIQKFNRLLLELIYPGIIEKIGGSDLKEIEDNFFVLNALRFLFPSLNNSGKYGRIPNRIAEFYLKSYKTYEKDVKKTGIEQFLSEEIEKDILLEISSSRFTVSSISKWPDFLESFNQSNGKESQKYIYELLGEESKNGIKSWKTGQKVPAKTKNLIIAGLNKILKNEAFYDENQFKNIQLNYEGDALKTNGYKNLGKAEKIRFNRILLEEIYPNSIKSSEERYLKKKVDKELRLFCELFVLEEMEQCDLTNSILDYDKLIGSLNAQKNDYIKRVFANLNENCQKIITNYRSGNLIDKSQEESIVSGFNEILDKQDFYDETTFKAFKLKEFCPKGEQNLKDRRKFNRLLLERIFPNEIKKNQIGSATTVTQVINASETLKSLKWLIEQFAKLD